MAQASLEQGQLAQASGYASQVLVWLEEHGLGGLYDAVGLYLTCYHVLAAQPDLRAASVLRSGYHELQRRAAAIGDRFGGRPI